MQSGSTMPRVRNLGSGVGVAGLDPKEGLKGRFQLNGGVLYECGYCGISVNTLYLQNKQWICEICEKNEHNQ